jgi:hypothetical protein
MNWKIKVAMAVWTLAISVFLGVVSLRHHIHWEILILAVVCFLGGIFNLRAGLLKKARGQRLPG